MYFGWTFLRTQSKCDVDSGIGKRGGRKNNTKQNKTKRKRKGILLKKLVWIQVILIWEILNINLCIWINKELSSKANIIEEKPKPKNNRFRKQNSRTKPNASNKVQNPTTKKWGNCFVYGKFGHHTTQCPHRKRTKKSNSKANLAETEVITIVISFKVSMVTDMKDWVVDSRATRHIYGNKSGFTSYINVKKGEEQVSMGNSRSTPMIGKWKILLTVTSGKVLAFSNVLHVLDIH